MKNIDVYKKFKASVDKKENASFRYIYSTKEGDTIIIDVYYDKNKGFKIVKDSRRDQFGQKKIYKYNYKYIYEQEIVNKKEKDSEHLIDVMFSNKDTVDKALADSTLDTYSLFKYKK